MGNPWDNDPIVNAPGPVYGLPRTPAPQTQAQATGDQLGVVHQQQQIDQVPLQNESTRVNIAQGQQSLGNTTFNQKDKLRSDFQALPPVKTYNEFLPALFKAVQAPDNAQGDLAVLYSFSKAMDPTTGVREGEQSMARNTASLQEQANVWINRINQGERLPAAVRHQFVETMRETGHQYARSYGQQRQFYTDLAKRNSFDPNEIVGPDAYAPFASAEQSYVTEHGGQPKVEGVPVPNGPVASGTGTQAGFDLKTDPRHTSLTPDQTAAYTAWWKAHPDPTPDQLNSFLHSMGLPGNVQHAEEIIASAKKGRISTDVEIRPDISDSRGQGGAGETIDAGIRGAVDTPTLGLADKAAAVGDTITRGGTFDQNLARQYAISDYDSEHHPYVRTGSQIAGGLALPMGEMSSVPQVALKSGALGAAYATGSSRSLSDVPMNALTGFAGGAAVGGAIGAAGKGLAALRGRGAQEVPSLVDSATGELNQPMDAMRPADRVQSMKDYGLETITPGMAGGRTARVLEQGLNNVPGSAGVMEDVNSVAGKELRRSMQGVAQQFGTSKTLNEGGSELQRGAREWMTRFDATTSKAYDAIPLSPQAPTTLTNTKGTLEQLAGKLESNPDLAEEIKDPTLLRYLDAINKHGLNWHDLKDFRTFVGNKIGQFRFSEDARTGDYRALYGALSEDMRNSAAAQGPQALRAFERANSLKAEGERRIEESLVRILGPDAKGSPERAAAAVQAMTRGGKGTGDLAKLAQVRAATVKSGAWDEVASTMIHLGGQPANSEGRAFSPTTFVQWYSDMSEPARVMLFKPELRKSLDGFVAMNQQLSRVKGLTNSSNTTPTMIGSGAVAASGMLAVAHPTALAIPILGGVANYGMAKLWTNSKFVSLITGYGRAVAAGNQNAVKSQIGRLGKLAVTNPELRQPLIALQQKLLAGANDNMGVVSGAAASGSDPNSDQQ